MNIFRSRRAFVLFSVAFATAASHDALAGIEAGACCVGQVCQDNSGGGMDRGTCEQTPGGIFQGDGSSCQKVNCAVPAASTWGLISFALLTAICGTLVLRGHAVERALPVATQAQWTERRAEPALHSVCAAIAASLTLCVVSAIAEGPQRFPSQRGERFAKHAPSIDGAQSMALLVSSQSIWGEGTSGQSKVVGYRQTMRVQREPRGNNVAIAGCGDEAVVEVVANALTWGAAGGEVPTRVDWRLGAGAWQGAFGGGDVTVGMTDTLDLSGGGELIVKSKTAYPSFTNHYFFKEIESAHPAFSILLVDGDNPVVKLGLKGAQGPFGGQPSVPEILAPYMDIDGTVNLAANELIAMYEMGSADVTEPTADYQDLVLKIRTGCGIGSEVVLRDSIGVDNTSTNGNWPFMSDRTAPNSWSIAPATVQVNEDITLTEFRGILAQMTPMSDFNQLDYWLRVWSSEAAAIANPNDGDIADIFFPVPTSGPSNFGTTVNQDFVGVKPTWDVRFDISSSNIQVVAGQSIVIGVQVYTNGTSGGGFWGWMESLELGQSDIQIGNDLNGGWRYINSSSRSFHDGRLGVKLTGQTF